MVILNITPRAKFCIIRLAYIQHFLAFSFSPLSNLNSENDRNWQRRNFVLTSSTVSFIFTRPFPQARKSWLKATTRWCWTSILVLTRTLYFPLPSSEVSVLALVLPPRRSDSPMACTTRVGGGPFPSEQRIISIFVSWFHFSSFKRVPWCSGRWCPFPGDRPWVWYYHSSS